MTIPELGTLREVDVRLAWVHEAQSFTPWLAQHLDALADEIGIPLELEGVEVNVGSFSADILARNPQDDSLVLIENQLEITNHDHLGKIMTYLAGLGAKVIIWIARDFRNEHLSAVRWLNDHTADPFAFFAVRVKVVQIGGSPLAPIFEVLEKPNEWERQLQAVSDETKTLSETGQFRLAFWTHYLSRNADEAKDGQAGAYSNRWRTIGDFVISYYVAQRSVGVFIRGRRNVAGRDVYLALQPHEAMLREATGAEFGVPEGQHFFVSYIRANTSDKARWSELADWLHEKMKLYDSALRAIG
jgi:hypothetical protein